MQNPYQPDGWRYILSGIDRLNDEGLEVRGQVIGRPTGTLLGLELSFNNHIFGEIGKDPIAVERAAGRFPVTRYRLDPCQSVGAHAAPPNCLALWSSNCCRLSATCANALETPPSIRRICPVTKRPSVEASSATIAARSSG